MNSRFLLGRSLHMGNMRIVRSVAASFIPSSVPQPSLLINQSKASSTHDLSLHTRKRAHLAEGNPEGALCGSRGFIPVDMQLH